MQTLSAQIPWSHNTMIIEKCRDLQEREFYLRLAIRFGLSFRSLERRVNSGEYQRYLLNQTNFPYTVAEPHVEQALMAVKDDYNLDFLGLADEHTERQLEDAVVTNIVPVLRELGGYFTFVGRQFRLVVNDEEYFVDLLFFHRKLRCLVAVELKAGRFQPEYAGKMQFYLSALDDLERLEDENPSLGMIICRSKDRTMVEYTLRNVQRPIGVASYNQYASLEAMPETIARYLPSPEEIARRLADLPE